MIPRAGTFVTFTGAGFLFSTRLRRNIEAMYHVSSKTEIDFGGCRGSDDLTQSEHESI